MLRTTKTFQLTGEFICSLLIVLISFYLFVVFSMSVCEAKDCGVVRHDLGIALAFCPFFTWPAWLYKHKFERNKRLAIVLLSFAAIGIIPVVGMLIYYAILALKVYQ